MLHAAPELSHHEEKTSAYLAAQLRSFGYTVTERVDAIKCDVEGAEYAVLRGSTSTLDRFHPMVLIEIDSRWAERYGNTASDVFTFLTERGYTVLPLEVYLKRGRIKVLLGVCKGKKHYDKRHEVKKRDAEREVRAALKRGR